jgi:hypothetical protein
MPAPEQKLGLVDLLHSAVLGSGAEVKGMALVAGRMLMGGVAKVGLGHVVVIQGTRLERKLQGGASKLTPTTSRYLPLLPVNSHSLPLTPTPSR